MSTPASSASVEMSSAPAGVTCCQRTSPFVLIVHATAAPAGAGVGAGAAVCASAVAWVATDRASSNRACRGERATMVILRWPPISPHGEAARKPGWLSPIEGRQIGARERLFAAALSRLRAGLQAAAPRRGRGAGRLAARGSGQATSLRARVPALAAPVSLRRHRAPRPRPRSEEHTSELQSRGHLVCRLLLEKKKTTIILPYITGNDRRYPYLTPDWLLVY